MAMLLPAATESCSAVVTEVLGENGPGVPFAKNASGLPDRPADVADRELPPAIVPSVHFATVATPLASVVAEPPVTVPPPLATAKLTDTPGTPLPMPSWTIAA